jgi:hypothetical protein
MRFQVLKLDTGVLLQNDSTTACHSIIAYAAIIIYEAHITSGSSSYSLHSTDVTEAADDWSNPPTPFSVSSLLSVSITPGNRLLPYQQIDLCPPNPHIHAQICWLSLTESTVLMQHRTLR